LKLYYSQGACSLSPHIVLKEAGLSAELVQASTKTHRLEDGTDYYTINPLGYVPLLELDDGTRLREGPAIVQYLADQVPDKKLAPPNGTLERYQMQSWLTFIGTELHKSFSPLFNPSTSEEAKTASKDKLKSRYTWVDEQLADKQFLLGDTFTVADAYLFTVTNWSKRVGPDLMSFANLQAWHARVGARPAVQEAMKAEGLIKG
jgi:glutathione S-transferase